MQQAAAVVVLALQGPGALAVPRPGTDGPVPEAGPGPVEDVVVDGPCLTTVATGGATGAGHTDGWRGPVPEQAHRHGTGQGQVVAVIDTGVNPGPAFPRLRGGGDYVAARDGLSDCDAHGTLVAGIIAASGADGGYTGVAPGVEVVSIRQSSSVFRPGPTTGTGPGAPDAPPETGVGDGVGTLTTLARAVRAAADSGADVINISEVACVPAGTDLADQPLGAALRYAAVDRDAVVVAAAGNTGAGCREQNPGRPDPSGSDDDGWASVRTVASPAWYDGLVLTVAAVDDRGVPADFSLRAPWVDVAAPGVGLRSVGADGAGYADRVVRSDGRLTPLTGTSFAAPYVAGVAALVRQAHPDLDARQVIARIERTALPAAGGHDFAVGYGVVDPVAAVTAVAPGVRPDPVSAPLAEARSPNDPAGPGVGGLVATGALVLASLAVVTAVLLRRR